MAGAAISRKNELLASALTAVFLSFVPYSISSLVFVLLVPVLAQHQLYSIPSQSLLSDLPAHVFGSLIFLCILVFLCMHWGLKLRFSGIAASLALLILLYAADSVLARQGIAVIQVLASQIAMLSTSLFYYVVVRARDLAKTRSALMIQKFRLSDFLFALALVPLFYFFAFAINYFLLVPAGFGDSQKIMEKLVTVHPFVLVLAVVLAPVSEELFFRGFLLQKLGILPSAIMFGLLHFAYGSIAQIVIAIVLGLLLGVVAISRNLNTCVYFHIVFNSLTILAIAFA